MDLNTSGKRSTRFDAFHKALDNANILFNCVLTKPEYDYRTLETIEPAIDAMASATVAQRWYVHSVDIDR